MISVRFRLPLTHSARGRCGSGDAGMATLEPVLLALRLIQHLATKLEQGHKNQRYRDDTPVDRLRSLEGKPYMLDDTARHASPQVEFMVRE